MPHKHEAHENIPGNCLAVFAFFGGKADFVKGNAHFGGGVADACQKSSKGALRRMEIAPGNVINLNLDQRFLRLA